MAMPGMPVPIHTPPLALEGLAEPTRAHIVLHALLCSAPLACCPSVFVAMGFLLSWFLLLQSTGSRCVGFSSYSAWAQQLQHTSPRVWARELWCGGVTAAYRIFPDQGSNPCSLNWQADLNHWATREVPFLTFLII